MTPQGRQRLLDRSLSGHSADLDSLAAGNVSIGPHEQSSGQRHRRCLADSSVSMSCRRDHQRPESLQNCTSTSEGASRLRAVAGFWLLNDGWCRYRTAAIRISVRTTPQTGRMTDPLAYRYFNGRFLMYRQQLRPVKVRHMPAT